jgi:hypothetical protein
MPVCQELFYLFSLDITHLGVYLKTIKIKLEVRMTAIEELAAMIVAAVERGKDNPPTLVGSSVEENGGDA